MQLKVESLAGLVVVSLTPTPVPRSRQLDMDVALGIKGKGGGGVAAFPSPTRRTEAGVVVRSNIGQQRDTGSPVLALVLLAADQAYITVASTPGILTRFWFRAVTPVGVGGILACGTILAGITLTLVDVHFTVHACMEDNIVLQRMTFTKYYT